LRTTALDAGRVMVTAQGDVVRATSAHLLDDLVKLLIDGLPVLLDVSRLQLEWAPAPEVFVAAVSSAGGWPYARLVLFGADAPTAERLRSCRIPESVFLAGTREQAATLVDVRPHRLSRGIDLPARPESIQRAREFLRDTDDRWGLPDRDETASVVAELVTNAVVHAGTGLRLRFVLDRNGLRVSVRDRRPGAVTPGPGLRNCTAPSGSGEDALGKLFLPPDLVMSHQQAINLTEQQRALIQSNMMDTQKKLLDQQFKLQGELEKLQSLLKSMTPDEGKVLEEMDKVLGAERDIKRAQLSLMVKLKNSLTQQQQQQLEALRNKLQEK